MTLLMLFSALPDVVPVDPVPVDTTFTLAGSMRKERGAPVITLTWTGSKATAWDVYRNGLAIVRATTTPTYIDRPGKRGGMYYRYTVCDAATAISSNPVIIQT